MSSARWPAARRAAGHSVLISTGDKDMAQLVDGSITLINTMSNSVLDRAGVKAKFDVYPEQIIDYLALVGDSSDNIPGIEKVGPKTAAKWLGQYGTLDNLIAHAQEISGKVGENLRAGLATLGAVAQTRDDPYRPRDAALVGAADAGAAGCRAVARVVHALRVARVVAAARWWKPARPARGCRGEPPLSRIARRGRRSGGRRRQRRCASQAPAEPTPHAAAVIERRYETITTWPDLERWITALRNTDLFAFDTETTSLDYMKAEIVGLSFCIEAGVAAYVPLASRLCGRAGAARSRRGCSPRSSPSWRIPSAAKSATI